MLSKLKVTFLLIIAITALQAGAQASDNSNPQAHITYEVIDNEGRSLPAVLNELSARPATTIIFGSDEDGALVEAAKEAEKTNVKKGKQFFVLPYGKAVKQDQPNGLNKLFRSIDSKVKGLVSQDPIGVAVATIALGADTYMWINVDQLSTLEKSTNVLFTIATGLVFAINKDMWANTTAKIREAIGLGKIGRENSFRGDVTKFVSSWALASVINSARIPLMNLDSLTNLNAWDFLDPIKVSFFTTMGATWFFEYVSSVRKDIQPNSKFMARRIIEIRGLLAGTLATSAALFSAGNFNIVPWVTLTVSGIAGYTLYKNSKKITNWFENNNAITEIRRKFRSRACVNILMN